MELYPIDLAIHLVNIVVLYILLRVLVWKPVRKFMADRQARVQAEMDEAARLQADARQSKADYDAKLAGAQAQVEQLLSQGRKEAADASQKYLDDAKAEAQHLLDRARADAEAEKRRAMDDAKTQLADLAVDMAGRVLRFGQDTQQRLLSGSAEKSGTRKGVLRLAAPCSDAERAAITDRLEQLLGCHLELTTEIDPELVGGFSALVDGQVYDFSYAAQLKVLQQKLA